MNKELTVNITQWHYRGVYNELPFDIMELSKPPNAGSGGIENPIEI